MWRLKDNRSSCDPVIRTAHKTLCKLYGGYKMRWAVLWPIYLWKKGEEIWMEKNVWENIESSEHLDRAVRAVYIWRRMRTLAGMWRWSGCGSRREKAGKESGRRPLFCVICAIRCCRWCMSCFMRKSGIWWWNMWME